MTPLLCLQHLTYYYPQSTTPSLDDISFEIGPGEFVLLMGASGSSKTTLLQVIAGLLPYSVGGRIKGNVLIEGTDIIRTPQAKRGVVGLVLQDPESQLVSLTVEDEIRFGPENLLLPREEVNTRLEWALDRCRLTEIRNAFVYALSGGQKQRIVIAAGLAMKPRLLCLDGPTTNLDPMGTHEVMKVTQELLRDGSVESVIISSNKVDGLLPYATRIIVIDQGKVVLDGKPEEVIGQYVKELQELGLFVPEMARLFTEYHFSQNGSRGWLPRTVSDMAALLETKNLAAPHIAVEPKTPVISIAALNHVSFGYTPGKKVLRDISLTIQKGQFLAVVGQNGSGKTTLMNLLAGLREPQSGSILVDGINVRDLRPGTVGYVFQSPDHQFVDPTSVWNELAFGLKQLKYSEEMINQRVTSVLELFGLQGIKDTIPYDLSMGQKRFLSVATMLVLQPKILILDEPTTGLDARLTTKLMTILQKLVEEGMTVIQVSHDMEQIAQYCQRVVVIGSEGNIVFDDTPRTLFANQPVLQSTMLEAPPASRLAQTLWPNHSPLPITVEEFQLSGGNHATT